MEELDGNAAAGMLSEVFALEVTGARGRCEVVIRCRACDAVLLVLVRGDGRYWLGVRGMTWLELRPS